MTLCNDAGTYLRCGEFSTLEFLDEEDDDDSEAWTALDLHHKYVSEKSGSVYIGNTTKLPPKTLKRHQPINKYLKHCQNKNNITNKSNCLSSGNLPSNFWSDFL
jgi:hypothetical protein